MHMQTHNSLTKNEMTSFGLLIKVNRDCKIVIYQHIFVSFPVKKSFRMQTYVVATSDAWYFFHRGVSLRIRTMVHVPANAVARHSSFQEFPVVLRSLKIYGSE